MKTTNRFNLPQPVVDAVNNDSYSVGFGDISITGLLGAPRIRVLKKLHDDQLTEDVSERIYSLLGQTMHGVLERANRTGLVEKRFYCQLGGTLISGQADAVLDNGTLQDYKLVSQYQVQQSNVKPEFEAQLNSYAYLVKHGYYLADEKDETSQKIYLEAEITKLQDVFFLRDWSKSKAKYDSSLPQQQVITMDVSLWGDKKTLAFLQKRIKVHKDAAKKLPECTPEERWATANKYAVMPKKGAARSLKNHDSKEMAEQHSANVPGSFVEFRPGKNIRCEDWCPVSSVCEQFKKLKEEK